MALTHEVLQLMREENLFQLYSEQYENLARIYWAAKDRDEAVKYAKMSLEMLVEQGYIQRVEPEHLQMVLNTFEGEG